MKLYNFEAYTTGGVRFFSNKAYFFPGLTTGNMAKTFYKSASRFARATGKTIGSIWVNGKRYAM